MLCGTMTARGTEDMTRADRAAVLARLAGRVLGLTARPRLVAVDGVDGAGKTVFADALAQVLRSRGAPVLRVGIDGFHRPRAERYRRGRTSPEGFFLDSYDLEAFRRVVVEPTRPGGSRLVRTAVFDHRTDLVVEAPPEHVDDDAVVLVDGLFLHRDELAGAWDLSVFLSASFERTFARMALRDGCPPDPSAPENRRYVEGQRLYLRTCDPRSRADLVVDNDDVDHPVLLDGDTA